MSNNSKQKSVLSVNPNKHIGKEISTKKYYNLISTFLCYGFIVNMLMVANLGDFARTIHPLLFILIYLITTFIGVIIMSNSKNSFITFIGYNFIILPVGLLLATCLPSFSLNDIAWAFGITLIVTLGIMIISNIFPNIFRSMGKGLFISLLLILVIEISLLLFGIHLGWIDYICCIIFSLYIGYDWVKAGDNYKSTTTAILAAANLYLDIINLFLRLLNIKSND